MNLLMMFISCLRLKWYTSKLLSKKVGWYLYMVITIPFISTLILLRSFAYSWNTEIMKVGSSFLTFFCFLIPLVEAVCFYFELHNSEHKFSFSEKRRKALLKYCIALLIFTICFIFSYIAAVISIIKNRFLTNSDISLQYAILVAAVYLLIIDPTQNNIIRFSDTYFTSGLYYLKYSSIKKITIGKTIYKGYNKVFFYDENDKVLGFDHLFEEEINFIKAHVNEGEVIS